MSLPPVILASTSPRRSELLLQLGLAFTVVASDSDEVESEHLTARELALINAHRKARSVAKKHPDALVLGADTVVSLGGKLLGKPKNADEAKSMLASLQGQTHQVVTGVSLARLRDHRERLVSDLTDVRFRELTEAEIIRYLDQINPLDKAGAYAIQEHGELIVEEITGSFSNVMGLPMERLKAELREWEI
jgi:septum formation protein